MVDYSIGGELDLLELAVEDEGAEGHERGREGEAELEQGPAVAQGGLNQENREENEEGTVQGAADLDEDGHVGEVFEGHGDPQQEEVGKAYEHASGAQALDQGHRAGSFRRTGSKPIVPPERQAGLPDCHSRWG